MSDSESDAPTRHHKKCHMLMTVQKLFQSHAYNQGSSSDIRAEPQKEPRPVVQLPALESTHRSPFASASLFSQSSPAKVPLHPVPEEPFPPAITPVPNHPRLPSLRTRPSKMLISDLYQATKVDLADDRSINGNSNSTRAKCAWDANDSFLPRAKPPPPLKLVPKERKSSKNPKNIKSPSEPSLSSRPSSPHHGSSQPLSKSRSVGSRPIQRTIGRPILEGPIERYDDVIDVRPSLTRSSTRVTISSEASASNLTLDVLPPEPRCAWSWRPPASWSGPPEATSADEDNEPKPGGGFGFIGRKRVKSVVPKGGVRDQLKSARSSEKVASVHLADVLDPEEKAAVVRAQRGSIARAEVVEVQCYKGWDEKPAADIIHKLRELKCK